VNNYHINVFFSSEDNCFVADIPDLQYCSAFGDSPQEALAEVLVAQEVWLESARANNIAIPIPTYRPSIVNVA